LKTPDRPAIATTVDAVLRTLVPRDHELLKIKAVVDWDAIDPILDPYYPDGGRPAYPALRMVRALMVQFWADLTDERLEVELRCNLLYREFVGVGLLEATPDEDTVADFRNRLGDEGIDAIFVEVNRQLDGLGLIGKDRRVLDGVHLLAKVAHRSIGELIHGGIERVLDAIDGGDAELATRLERGVRDLHTEPQPESPRPEASAARMRAQWLLAEAEPHADGALRAALDDLRAVSREEDRQVSFVDRDARWGHKRKDFAFLGYKVHESMDPDSRLTTAVEVVPGNTHEGVRTGELLDAETAPLNDNAAVIGDSLYNNATTIEQVRERGLTPHFVAMKARVVADDFSYDVALDRLTCRAGRHSIGKTRLKSCAGDQYYFSTRDCRGCEHAATCLTRGEREGSAMPRRRVALTDARKTQQAAGETHRQQMKVRSRIEAKFDEQMNRHGLRRARYVGLRRVRAQVLWTVVVVNLKRAARLLAGRARMPTLVAPSREEAA
jgi:IS5 family transposase